MVRSYCILIIAILYSLYVFWRCGPYHIKSTTCCFRVQGMSPSVDTPHPLGLEKEEEKPQPNWSLHGAPWNQGAAIISNASDLENGHIVLMFCNGFNVKVIS